MFISVYLWLIVFWFRLVRVRLFEFVVLTEQPNNRIMPVRKKRIYIHRTTHGRGSEARAVIHLAAYVIVLLIIGILVVFLGDWVGHRGGHDEKPAARQPAGILRR